MYKAVILFFLFALPVTGSAQKKNLQQLQDMYDAIQMAGILHPDIVMAQCIQETGWLSCKSCCLRYHNLFGFYIKGNKCKKFESDAACITYYRQWQEKRYETWKKKFPKEDYYHFLKKADFATGDKYTNEIKPKVAWVRKHLKL